MGGYGAFKLALTHPGRYTAAGSFSGALDIGARFWNSDPQWNAAMEMVFGPLNKVSGSSNDLLHLCEEVAAGSKCPRLYQWCGTEDFLYQDNLTFKNKALSLDLPLTYQESPGDHQWKYWDVCIQKFLEFINKE
jgi:S-formylglutathione hydrolase FrmB